MKPIFQILLIQLILISNLSAQYELIEKELILFDEMSTSEINKKGILIDKVNSDRGIALLEYIHEGKRKKLVRISDTTFHYRSFLKNELFEKGKFKIASCTSCKSDTVINLCYPESIEIYKPKKLIKIGKWLKITPGGESEYVSFNLNRKDGIEISYDYKNKKSISTYNKGILQESINPNSDQVKELIYYLLDEKLYTNLFKIEKDQFIFLIESEKLNFVKKPKYFTNFGTITLKKNKEFSIEFSTEDKAVKGKWQLNGNKLSLKYNNENYRFMIHKIGMNEIELYPIRKR